MRNKKILILDDDPDVLQGMHVRLKANHYDTCLAGDTFSGVAEARRSMPDLILLDLGLPTGGGFLVMERLKLIPALAIIPIITVSARDGLGNQKRAFDAGAKAFLQKPIDDAELLAVVRQALGEGERKEALTLLRPGKDLTSGIQIVSTTPGDQVTTVTVPTDDYELVRYVET
jgi:DNA-binding response OmpR family regulator